MSQELIYTSAPRGIKPGSQGFCTVACTRGMSPNLMQQLESLSGYRQIYPPQDPKAALNPVAFSHLMLAVGGRRCHLLSRICDAGLDYTQRTNKFAHHLVLDAAEAPSAGPAWLLAAPGFMRSKWEGDPATLPTGPAIPQGQSPPRICRAWQQLTGDAGWGGVLAETAKGTAGRQVVLIFRPGMDMLALVAEALCLLPAEVRWRVSFSTYFIKLPAGVGCQWRCVCEGTPEAVEARRAAKNTLVIDLCRPLGRAAGGAYVETARTGKMRVAIAAAAPQPAEIELERALREADRPPMGTGVGSPLSSNANAGVYPLRPPPSIASVRPPPPPGPRLRRRPQRKPAQRWPWVLGIVASILIVVGGGILLERVAAARRIDSKVAQAKNAADRAAKAAEDAKNAANIAKAKAAEAKNAVTAAEGYARTAGEKEKETLKAGDDVKNRAKQDHNAAEVVKTKADIAAKDARKAADQAQTVAKAGEDAKNAAEDAARTAAQKADEADGAARGARNAAQEAGKGAEEAKRAENAAKMARNDREEAAKAVREAKESAKAGVGQSAAANGSAGSAEKHVKEASQALEKTPVAKATMPQSQPASTGPVKAKAAEAGAGSPAQIVSATTGDGPGSKPSNSATTTEKKEPSTAPNPFDDFPSAISLDPYPPRSPTGAQSTVVGNTIGKVKLGPAGVQIMGVELDLLTDDVFPSSMTCNLEPSNPTKPGSPREWNVTLTPTKQQTPERFARFLLKEDGTLKFQWIEGASDRSKTHMNLLRNCLLKLSTLGSNPANSRVVRLRTAALIERPVTFTSKQDLPIAVLKDLPEGAHPLLRVTKVDGQSGGQQTLKVDFPPGLGEKPEITFGENNMVHYSLYTATSGIEKAEKNVVLKYEGVQLENPDDWKDLRGVRRHPLAPLTGNHVKQHLVNLDKQHTPEMDREHMGQDLKRQIDTAKTLAKCLDAIQKKAVLHFHVCIMVRDHEVGLATTDPPYDYGNNSDRDRTK